MHGTMYRAEVEPMPENPEDRVPRTGLYKIVIYEGGRFVRSDKEYITHSAATKLADELNFKFGANRKAKAAGQ